MILLSLQGIQKSFGTNEVLRDASLVLQDGQRMGLVGVNGCGKSTLMKIIAGIETADGGTMTMQKGLKLGYLAQQGQVGEGRTVLEELESVFEPVQRMEQQLRDLEHQMADAHDEASLHRLGSQYDQLTRRFEESNGYGMDPTQPVYGNGEDYKYVGGYFQYLQNKSDQISDPDWKKMAASQVTQNPVAVLDNYNCR